MHWIIVGILIGLVCILSGVLMYLLYPPIRNYIRRKIPVNPEKIQRRYQTIDGWMVTKVHTFCSCACSVLLCAVLFMTCWHWLSWFDCSDFMSLTLNRSCFAGELNGNTDGPPSLGRPLLGLRLGSSHGKSRVSHLHGALSSRWTGVVVGQCRVWARLSPLVHSGVAVEAQGMPLLPTTLSQYRWRRPESLEGEAPRIVSANESTETRNRLLPGPWPRDTQLV
jgi:hypothetical protein